MSKKKKNEKLKVGLTKSEKIILCITTLLFVILALLVITNNIKWFDDLIFNFVSSFRCEGLTIFFKILTFLCSVEFILIFTILVVFLSKKHRKFFTLNIVGCVILNQALKHIFVRSRPVNINLITEAGYSFPSGHSMTAVAFYGYFISLIINSKLDKCKKILFTSLLMVLILLIGTSRIYLGVHYASDVLAGFSIATTYLIVFKLIERKKKSN